MLVTVLGLPLSVLVLLYLIALVQVLSFDSPTEVAGDAAIVLGARIDGSEPSPVFRERLNHGIRLLNDGRIERIILTGGFGQRADRSEAAVGRDYCLAQGIAADRLLGEERSTTTIGNLEEARAVGSAAGCRGYIIVSDPLHLRRATTIAAALEMQAVGSGTPTTRFRTLRSKAPFALREAFFLLRFRLLGF